MDIRRALHIPRAVYGTGFVKFSPEATTYPPGRDAMAICTQTRFGDSRIVAGLYAEFEYSHSFSLITRMKINPGSSIPQMPTYHFDLRATKRRSCCGWAGTGICSL